MNIKNDIVEYSNYYIENLLFYYNQYRILYKIKIICKK